MKQKIYISGKMSGIDKEVYTRTFNEAQQQLEAQGSEVVNPASLGWEDNQPWADIMIEDLKLLKQCDAIYMLPGWQFSNGAQAEYYFARGHKIEILPPDPQLQV